MRGPLLSGPIGSRATLQRLVELLGAAQPRLVVSNLWLAEALAAQQPVLALVEPDERRRALRAVRRLGSARLVVALAAEDLPLRAGGLGAIVLTELLAVEAEDAAALVATLGRALAPDGVLCALDAPAGPAEEARLAAAFLAGGLRRIGQERPRDGAVITLGTAPAPAVARLQP